MESETRIKITLKGETNYLIFTAKKGRIIPVEPGINLEYPSMIYHIHSGIIQDKTRHFYLFIKCKFVSGAI